MPNTEPQQPVRIEVTDGASIPDPKDKRILTAWSLSLTGAVALLIYLFAIGYLGYQGYRQTKTASDYLVAGRNANPVILK